MATFSMPTEVSPVNYAEIYRLYDCVGLVPVSNAAKAHLSVLLFKVKKLKFKVIVKWECSPSLNRSLVWWIRLNITLQCIRMHDHLVLSSLR